MTATARPPGRVWLAALLPIVPVALALAVHPVPQSADAVLLDGAWTVEVIDPAQRAGRARFQVPGAFFADGGRVSEALLERRFTLPEHLRGRDLFLMVPNLRGAFADVLVNEALVGAKGIRESDTSLDVGRLDGFAVPAAALAAPVPEHVLRLRLRFPTPGNALPDGRFLLGTPAVVHTYLERNLSVKHLLEYGALLVTLLGAGLIAYLLALRPRASGASHALAGEAGMREDRALYRAALAVMVATALYLCGKTGVVVGFVFGSADVNAFITYTIIGIGAATPELVESYYLRRTTRFRVLNRGVHAAALVASLALDIENVYPAYSLWLFVVIVHAIVFAVRDLLRPARAYGPVLASAIAVTAATAAVDLLSDLNIAWTPRLFSFGVANLGVIAAAIVLGDFLRLSRRAQALSATLVEQNVALTHALAAAEESARLKGEFLANTSHELRTPLNAIINIPQAMLDKLEERALVRCGSCGAVFEAELEPEADAENGLDGAACPECGAAALGRITQRVLAMDGDAIAARLGTVVSSGKHLLGVVSDILDASKLAALEAKGEQLSIEQEEARVADVVLAAVDTVAPLAEAAGVRLEVPPIPADLVVLGDRTRLAQVFMNLLSNALKFSPRGADIVVNVARVGEGPGEVEVRVRDRGPGIAPEHHALIFESFRQVEGGHTRKHGGTGLGLAIAKKLVELHGGAITVESALGEGATFIVRLPLTSAARRGAAART